MELKCPVCKSNYIIFDERHYELYCFTCGYVIEDLSLVLEIKYDRELNNLDKEVKYRRIKKYKERKAMKLLAEKYDKLGLPDYYFYRFIEYCHRKGIKNNNISRHMKKLYNDFVRECLEK
ncbi:TFIIB-type zinc ribbon-containing protein [Methanocaldococcus indicus]|uniref:TFIIB-type zinc ribbon-containing protein n=1 Tax=Methanocaldococcus indicus TaxID=213231 RepID=UPI003C6D6413